jgi:lipoprotein-anchoring transpeptidase ErfK/SrfK
MAERLTRAGTPERRNQTPPGRARRIFHDHRGPTLALFLGLAVAIGLFAATSAWALDARFATRVAEMTYNRDSRAMAFLREREATAVREVEQRVDELAALEEELAPGDRPYLVVSLAERRVWYLRGETDTLYTAPVAVGSGQTLVMGGRTQRFQTPRGRLTITKKERDPVWVPPDWHYHKIARERGLRVVNMRGARPDALAGFPPGQVPIRNGAVILPPWGSPQSRHTGVLGAAKLEMRDGYYFHGTQDEASIGTAASAGCIRMRRADILWMYDNVPVGTPVYIY